LPVKQVCNVVVDQKDLADVVNTASIQRCSKTNCFDKGTRSASLHSRRRVSTVDFRHRAISVSFSYSMQCKRATHNAELTFAFFFVLCHTLASHVITYWQNKAYVLFACARHTHIFLT